MTGGRRLTVATLTVAGVGGHMFCNHKKTQHHKLLSPTHKHTPPPTDPQTHTPPPTDPHTHTHKHSRPQTHKHTHTNTPTHPHTHTHCCGLRLLQVFVQDQQAWKSLTDPQTEGQVTTFSSSSRRTSEETEGGSGEGSHTHLLTHPSAHTPIRSHR